MIEVLGYQRERFRVNMAGVTDLAESVPRDCEDIFAETKPPKMLLSTLHRRRPVIASVKVGDRKGPMSQMSSCLQVSASSLVSSRACGLQRKVPENGDKIRK